MLPLNGDSHGERHVDTPKKRLTLDLEPPLQQRLKAVAALKGISMRQYCQTDIEKKLTKLLDALLSTGVELRESVSVHVKVMELADELKQNAVYAAQYLALVGVLDCELWTADERFYRAASSRHIQGRWIGSFTDG
jgi:predicted nucleic acid-binding protein